jgi:hypothetical protein
VVSFGIALAVAELVVRRYRPLEPPMRFGQLAVNVDRTVRKEYLAGDGKLRDGVVKSIPFDDLFEGHHELFWKFAPNIRLPDSYWPLFGLISNGQGLREDHDIPVPKPPGEIRILFVGDSCTYGYLLEWDQTVAHYTEELLRARHPDMAVESINAGVPAYSLFQGWRFLETEGMRYEPDLVVLNFTWNGSAVWDGQSDMTHYAHWKASQPTGPLRHLRLYQLLWSLTHPALPPPASEKWRPRLRRNEFKELLNEVQKKTLRHGVDLLLLVGAGRVNLDPDKNPEERVPFQLEQYYFGDKIKFGPDSGPGFVDTVPIVRALAETRPVPEIFHDADHPTAATNRKIARALADKLDPWLAARK